MGGVMLITALLGPAPLEAKILRYIDAEGMIWFVEVPAQAPFNQRQTSTPSELNLLRHYQWDLRQMVRGHAWQGSFLATDVGCRAFEQAKTALAKRDFAGVVRALHPTLQFSEAERLAWIRWLPELVRDEMRPTWQKAGVQR